MLAALLFVLPPTILAKPFQDPGEVHPPSPVEVLREQARGGGQGDEDEMKVLFEEIEQRLRDIDRMLYDASAGRGLESSAESGIGDLLERTRESNEEVLAGIDRILELAAQRKRQKGSGSSQQSQQGQGGQGGQQQPEGQSPLDQQPGEPSQREATPEGPGEEPGQEPGQEPGGEEPSQGERPEGNRDSDDEPQQGQGSNPPQDATGSGTAGAGDGRWGDLPVHVRELFRAQGSGDMPPQYRDWIDAYYRRLNRVP